MNFHIKSIEKLIDLSIKEDIAQGDITTNNIIPENSTAIAQIVSKTYGVIAGMPLAEIIFKKLDKNISFKQLFADGENVEPKNVLAEISGSYRAILSGERLALNFLQRMSGIATETQKYVKAIENYKTKILDTRKTIPGFRILDKYAVKTGGGTNHRFGLYDMVMIKDNHIKVAGSITNAVKQIKKNIKQNIKIEVETTNLEEVKEALKANADIIMLDNMSIDIIKQAVKIINHKSLSEASGNMSLDKVKEVAATGVDFISVGALTHSVKAMDISLNIK